MGEITRPIEWLRWGETIRMTLIWQAKDLEVFFFVGLSIHKMFKGGADDSCGKFLIDLDQIQYF